jgi:3-dehydroquinate synthase
MLQVKISQLMEGLVVFKDLVIQSHKGPYSVSFSESPISNVSELYEGEAHYIIDANVARLYKTELFDILEHPNTITIKATERNKSIDKIIPIFEQLVENKVRRDHVLIAIGGGIIQDITCFIASTLLRGVPWYLIPTTLLAQADSCIGSKSSINLTDTKNIIGTFNPPQKIFIHSCFLDTLDNKEIHSGIGEIIKVHAIDGASAYDNLTNDFDKLYSDRTTLLKYIQAALLIKKDYIEKDEFDAGIRNIFNYGHSFGHAIESATNYSVPHGIAISIGMDMANYISMQQGKLSKKHYQRMHPILRKNYANYASTPIPLDALLSALKKDKKNKGDMLGLIFPIGENADIQRIYIPSDDAFVVQCKMFLLAMAEE